MIQRRDVKTEDIVRLYVDERLIGREVAERLGCSIPLVQQRLKKAGIKMRPSNERKTLEPPSREVLKSLYWEEKLHPSQIGKTYGVCFTTVVNWMKDYGISFRTKSEARLGKLNPLYGVGHSEETKEKMSLLFLNGKRKAPKNNQYGNPTEYAGVVYRSSWEAAVAFYLDSCKVPFIYEYTSFRYEDEKKRSRSYTPDFYLPTGFGEIPYPLYIEVKGRFRERDDLKIDSARSQGNVVLLWDWVELQNRGIVNAAGKVLVGDGLLNKLGPSRVVRENTLS